MDCGVWTSQWKIRESLFSNYRCETVGAETRMKLAADLVLRPHNALASEMVVRALEHWRRKAVESSHANARS
ncbi:hypothetical protein PIB30_048241 [Stylosanthes scabra]|uniref:Uncharacterized protein n=1 Tax=Stylosanthes scabra TaxID=79078 RepID=A0ABU6WF22_9FABA|nr:hypothetical protein [Stylosanthes scabra]